MHVLLCKWLLGEHLGDLAAAVGTEVETDHNIAILDERIRLANGIANNDRLYEFVSNTIIVRLRQRCQRIGSMGACAMYHTIVGYFYTLPALVAVHSVEAAGKGGQFAAGMVQAGLQVRDEFETALRVSITAIGKGMHGKVRHLVFCSKAAEGLQVFDMGMYAAIADEAYEMKCLARRLGGIQGSKENGAAFQLAITNGNVDALQLLVYNAARAQIQVAHLRIAHLPVGQAHGLTAGNQLGMRVLII